MDLEPPPPPSPLDDDDDEPVDPDAGAPDWLRKEMRDREKAPKGAPPPLPDDDVVGEGGGSPVATDAGKPTGEKPTGAKPGNNGKAVEDGADAGSPADGTGGGPTAENGGADVTPDGGYKSVLPDDDELPAGIETDECEDPELVKKLPGIVIGKSLAETLKLELGGCVTVTSPTIGFQFSGGAVKPAVAKSFRVMALFEAGFDQYDSKLVYTDLYEAQVFYDEGDTVTGVEMKIADIEKSDDVVEAAKKVVPPASYRTMDWKELNKGLFTALLIQKVMMSGVLALIILVAAFTVVATLIMVVLDKKKEISVLKAMGATDTAILRVFLYQGLFIGGLGTALGLLIGYGVCESLVTWAFPLDPKVYFIDHLPVLLRTDEFVITGAVAIILCMIGTALPSLYAASLLPADGLRDIQGGSSGIEAGEVIRSGWESMRKHWPVLILVPVVGFTLTTGLGFLIPFAGITAVLVRSVVLAVYASAARGGPVPIADLLVAGIRRSPHVLLIDVARQIGLIAIVGVFVGPALLAYFYTDYQTLAFWAGVAGFAASIVPAIVFVQGTRLAPYFAADQGFSVVRAFRASWRATEGRRTDLVIYDAISGVVILLSSIILCVGGFVALAVVTAGEATIYVRLAKAIEPPRRQASIPDGAVVAS
jgi:ABC-type lipoprotein release transport system permease subunit